MSLKNNMANGPTTSFKGLLKAVNKEKGIAVANKAALKLGSGNTDPLGYPSTQVEDPASVKSRTGIIKKMLKK